MGNSMPNLMPKGQTGPMRLYVGSLHFNITEEMLRGIFEPFGKIENIQLMMDPENGRSKGYGFLTVSFEKLCERILKERVSKFLLDARRFVPGNRFSVLLRYEILFRYTTQYFRVPIYKAYHIDNNS